MTEVLEKPTLAIAERAHEVLDYDPLEGSFIHRADRGKNRCAGKQAGYVMPAGYILISIDDKRYYGHRLAWLMTHGVWPKGDVDHINGDRADNRLLNLRDVPRTLNSQNQRRPGRNNTTGYLGVTFDKRRQAFVAQIVSDGRHLHIGQFPSAPAAHAAYIAAKRQLHQGNTL